MHLEITNEKKNVGVDRSSELLPCITRSCLGVHFSISSLQLCHVPRGSATPGAKMFFIWSPKFKSGNK